MSELVQVRYVKVPSAFHSHIIANIECSPVETPSAVRPLESKSVLVWILQKQYKIVEAIS